MLSLRTWLVLGRVSNLPTVWSNCLAAWWLGGGGNLRKLFPLLLGATLLYLGGMFLNDAMDAGFDSQHRRDRPIPSGLVTAKSVWQMGFGMLAAGLVNLFLLGMTTGVLALILVVCILVYDALHKVFTLSPLIMAACRFFLYQVAASAGTEGVTGWSVWCGLALGAYIVGLSFLARKESTGLAVDYWPCLPLALPIFLALLMNAGAFQKNALILSALLALWIIRSLRHAYRAADRNVGLAVSGLLAGIVLVDLLAVADIGHGLAWIFIVLLGLALLFQRFVPAT
jgi:UbiA prenyltransferase family protein